MAETRGMYKHILVPTDGSKLSAKGIRAGVELARSMKAKVTGVYVIPPYAPPIYGEAALYYVPGMSPGEYENACRTAARKALQALQQEARKAGVACTTRVVSDTRPHAGILRAARAAKCDAIAMASHGRSAVGGLLLGSQTARILERSRLPVLVAR